MTAGERLRRWRERTGTSQVELARSLERLGLPEVIQSRISRWEADNDVPTELVREGLRVVAGIDPDEWLDAPTRRILRRLRKLPTAA